MVTKKTVLPDVPASTPAPKQSRRPPDVLSLIGNTPLVEVTRFDTGLCQLFLKLECQNPGGSIKDRIALTIIEVAERDGKLGPGGTVIEATAGNTGLGLALVSRAKGYHVVLVVPDKMSAEKIMHLKALGAEVYLTRSDVVKGHPAYYQDYAARLAQERPGAFYANQFGNPANPLAHETTTGPEIWQQTHHAVDAIVCGVGTGGTLTGLSRFFSRVQPALEMVLADPAGSVLADYVRTGQVGTVGAWLVEGIGEDFVPPIADLSRVRTAYTVTDAQSFGAARELLRREGILAGSSSGTLLDAALRYCREQTRPKRVVTFVCDTGSKYLSKMFNDYWMIDQGLLERVSEHNLRDLISHRFDAGAVVSVSPGDTLATAFQRMRMADVSQLPVLDGDHIVGLVDESDLLLGVYGNPGRFMEPVGSVMTRKLLVLAPDAPFDQLVDVLNRGLVALIVDGEHFVGLITRYDLLIHLRRLLS